MFEHVTLGPESYSFPFVLASKRKIKIIKYFYDAKKMEYF